MARNRIHTPALKQRVVQDYLAGQTLHNLSRRHNLPQSLIRIWVDQYVNPTPGDDPGEAVTLDEIAELAQTIHECEVRIEAIERLVARRVTQSQRQQPGGHPEGEPVDPVAPDTPEAKESAADEDSD